MGLSEKVAKSTIRLCFSKTNSLNDAKYASEAIFNEYNLVKV